MRDTLSFRTAPHASAYGTPPEKPITGNRPKPRSSASRPTISATLETDGRGGGVDRPYPGRSNVSTRSPDGEAKVGSARNKREPGVPWRRTTWDPSVSPHSH